MALEFWKSRTVKIRLSQGLGFSASKGTGILLNFNLLITNKHILPNSNLKRTTGSVVYQGKEYEIKKILATNGSLDVLFITLKEKIKTTTPLKLDWEFDDLLATHVERGESTISCGFPSDATDFTTSDITIGRGEILSTWFYEPGQSTDAKQKLGSETEKLLKKQPVFILSSNMIFCGNSGGPILDSKGRLIGLVFCTLKMGESQVINEMALSVNMCLISRLLWLFLKESNRSFNYTKQIDRNEILSIKEKVIEDAGEFYFQPKLLEKL